ncbi:MAG: hypothetical protein K2Y20_06390 [Sphingomonas sp.]|nr:hypothetical protein [Sphingomonas sp.]
MLLVTDHVANSDPKFAARAQIVKAGFGYAGKRPLRAIAADPMPKKSAARRRRREAGSARGSIVSNSLDGGEAFGELLHRFVGDLTL